MLMQKSHNPQPCTRASVIHFIRRHARRPLHQIGNRDANKLRLIAELSEAEVRDRDVTTMPRSDAMGRVEGSVLAVVMPPLCHSMPVVMCDITPLEHLHQVSLRQHWGVEWVRWLKLARRFS